MNVRLAVLGALFAALSACASSHVMIGTARPAIAPEQVKIYFHPPAKYEEIALIDTSNRGKVAFTEQGKTDIVIQRLKIEAAKLGANGVLLQGISNQSAGSVGTGFGTATATGGTAYGSGLGISSSIFQKEGNGLAIYVPPES